MRTILMGLLVMGCGGGEEPDEPPVLPGTVAAPCELVSEGWRITSIEVPLGAVEAETYGFNLDLDEGDLVDNGLGSFAAMMSMNGADIETPAGEVLSSAELAWGLEVQRCADGGVDHLRVEAVAGTFDEASGRISVELGGIPAVGASSAAAEGQGTAPLSIFLDAQTDPSLVEWSEMLGFAVELDAEAGDTLTGRLGMAFPGASGRETLNRSVARLLASLTAADPGCPEACDADLASLIRAFGGEDDGVVTEDDLAANDLMGTLLFPDVDLLDGDLYWPLHDGVEDSISLGVRFTAERVELRR